MSAVFPMPTRLPDPPKEYSQDYFKRLIEMIEANQSLLYNMPWPYVLDTDKVIWKIEVDTLGVLSAVAT